MHISTVCRALSFLVVPTLLTVGVPSADAQQNPQPRQRDFGWVSATAGTTVGSQTPTAATFAGEYGDDVHPRVQAHVTISYFENVMTQDFEDELSLLSAGLTAISGTAWNLQGRDRAVTMIVGGRYLLATQGTIRPYVGGGGGVINLRRTIVDIHAGNVASAVLTDLGVGDFSLVGQSVTKPLLEAAVGVGVYRGPLYLDIGYRFNRAFHLSEPLDISRIAVGIGYKF